MYQVDCLRMVKNTPTAVQVIKMFRVTFTEDRIRDTKYLKQEWKCVFQWSTRFTNAFLITLHISLSLMYILPQVQFYCCKTNRSTDITLNRTRNKCYAFLNKHYSKTKFKIKDINMNEVYMFYFILYVSILCE